MVTIKLNTAGFDRKIASLARELKLSQEDILTKVAQTGCRNLASRSQPYGFGSKQKDILQKAVYKDINRAYNDIPQTYNAIKKIDQEKAKQFMYFAINKDYDNAFRVAERTIGVMRVEEAEQGDYLDSVRTTSKRRVRLGVEPIVLLNNNSFDTLKSKFVVSAGTLKASFLSAAQKLGSKAFIQKWLRKGGLSNVTKTKTSDSFIINVTSLVTYASNHMTPNEIGIAIKDAYRFQQNYLNRQLKAITDRFNRN